MEVVERVVWSEGMLMSPQHLQQQDAYHERYVGARLAALTPYSWGVARIEIDAGALASGQLRLHEFVGVMPDGLPLACGGGRAGPPARSIEERFSPTQRLLQVYLAVPREREGIANVVDGGEHVTQARFDSVARGVTDMVSGKGAQVSVSFARPNVTILFDDEASEDFVSLKVAEITRDAAGVLAVSDQYVPPSLCIGASPMIMGGLRRLLSLSAARQRALGETARERTKATIEFRSADITGFLQLSALNAMLPVLSHLTDEPQVSPWHAYVLLTQLAGQLTTFSANLDPTALPKFVHTDLGQTFTDLFDYITQLLSATIIRKFVEVPLKLYPNGMMLAELNEERLVRCSTYVLAAKCMKSELVGEKLAIELPKLSKIGSKATIKDFVRTASNGVPLTVARHLPPEIPVRDGVSYFSVETSDDAWKAVLNDHTVAIFVPQPYNPGNVAYKLFAVPRDEGH